MPQRPDIAVQNGELDLNQLRKRAKQRLRQMQHATFPDAQRDLLHRADAPVLADAQWLVARELGFASWPKLKAHADAVAFAAQNPRFIADDEASTQHWRCGNDIAHALQVAGFRGEFRMFADPFCMGPVPRLPEQAFIETRCEFISRTFDIPMPAVRQRAQVEYGALARMSEAKRVVMWCEADAYDQLFLIAVLANMSHTPALLELIDIDRVPSVERFVGMGQLSPKVLAWLWPKRRRIGQSAIALARAAWDAFRDASPLELSAFCREPHDELPLLAPALARQLQEVPALRDGLSLTERLALTAIRDAERTTLADVFAELTARRDPLPFLGDAMFHTIARSLMNGTAPLIKVHDAEGEPQTRVVGLTPLGEQVLRGEAYWLDHASETRWVGGVRIQPRSDHWALDEDLKPVLRRS